MTGRPALDGAALDAVFREARTYHRFTDAPVGEADLHAIWELAKMGPTSANSLPARILWLTSGPAKERLARHCQASNVEKVLKAPVAAIVAHDLEFHRLLPELYPPADAKSWFEGNAALRETTALRNGSLQGAYLILAARALGFDVGPMSGFDNAGVDADLLADHPDWRSNFIMVLGHGDPATVHPRSPRPDFARFNIVL